MDRHKKHGFTLVELVIVIAVIAVLSAVLIPTFSNVIRKAKISNYTQIVRNLNTAISNEVAGSEDLIPETEFDALSICEEAGYVVENLATKDDYYIAWNRVSGKFVLLEINKDGSASILYSQDEGSSDGLEFKEAFAEAEFDDLSARVNYYIVVGTDEDSDNYYRTIADQGFSVYCGPDFVGADYNKEEDAYTFKVGFDAGDALNIEEVLYDNTKSSETTANAQTVIIRTNDATDIVVKGFVAEDGKSGDIIHHYGDSGEQQISVASESYHEHGSSTFTKILKGHYVQEANSIVAYLDLVCSEGAVVVDLLSGSIQGTVTNSNETNSATINSEEGVYTIYFHLKTKVNGNPCGVLKVNLLSQPKFANTYDHEDGNAERSIKGVGSYGENGRVLYPSYVYCWDSVKSEWNHDYIEIEELNVRVCKVCGAIEYSRVYSDETTGKTEDGEDKLVKEKTIINWGDQGGDGVHGQTEGDLPEYSREIEKACEHSWGEWVVSFDASCVSDGLASSTCKYCGAVRYKAITATGHIFEDGECVVCHVKEGSTEAEHVHTWAIDKESSNATCLQDGVLVEVCCGEINGNPCNAKRVTVITATGHRWGLVSSDAASCESEGTNHYKCLNPNCTATKTEKTAVAGHLWGTWSSIEGGKHIRYCTRQGCSASQTGDHEYVLTGIAKAATCTEAGIAIYTCPICGDSYQESYGSALGHKLAVVDKDSVSHTRKCQNEGCEYTITAYHTFGEDGKCIIDGCNEVTQEASIVKKNIQLKVKTKEKEKIVDYYDSIEEALTEVSKSKYNNSEVEIVLLKNITAKNITLGRKVSINLNGNTITVAEDAEYLFHINCNTNADAISTRVENGYIDTSLIGNNFKAIVLVESGNVTQSDSDVLGFDVAVIDGSTPRDHCFVTFGIEYDYSAYTTDSSFLNYVLSFFNTEDKSISFDITAGTFGFNPYEYVRGYNNKYYQIDDETIRVGEYLITRSGSVQYTWTVTKYDAATAIMFTENAYEFVVGEEIDFAQLVQVVVNGSTMNLLDTDVRIKWYLDGIEDEDGKAAFGLEEEGNTHTIKVETNDDDSKLSATCTITLKKPNTGITLTDTNYTGICGFIGEQKQLNATVFYETNTTEQEAIVWSSENPAVATVGANGKVTFVGAGETKITATVKIDGAKYTDNWWKKLVEWIKPDEEHTATCNVTVYGIAFVVDEQEVSSFTSWYGKEHSLSIKTYPNGSILTLDCNGVEYENGTLRLTTVGKGSIKASITVNGTTIEKTLSLNTNGTTLVSSITGKLAGEKVQLNPVLYIDGAVYSGSAYRVDLSVNEAGKDVISIDGNNVVSINKAGRAVITASVVAVTNNDGNNSYCVQTCDVIVNGILVNNSKEKQEDGSYKYYVSEDNCTDFSASWMLYDQEHGEDGTDYITWVSNNTDIVEIVSQEKGKVTLRFLKSGKASITAKSTISEVDPETQQEKAIEYITTVDLDVWYPVKTISLSNEFIAGAEPYEDYTTSKQLTVTFNGGDATKVPTCKDVIWISGNENVAKVDENGLVTFNEPGTTTITVKSADNPSVSATCQVTTYNIVNGVNLGEEKTADIGDSTVWYKGCEDEHTLYAPYADGTGTNTSYTIPVRFCKYTGVTVGSYSVYSRESADADSNTELEWSVIEGTDVVSIDENGKVTALKAGTAVIKAQAKYGYDVEEFYDTFTINVVAVYGYWEQDGSKQTYDPAQYNGEDAVVLPTPTKTGYTFAGWYDAAGNKVANGGASYSNRNTIALYEHWNVNKYAVKVDTACKNVTVKIDGVEVAYGNSVQKDYGSTVTVTLVYDYNNGTAKSYYQYGDSTTHTNEASYTFTVPAGESVIHAECNGIAVESITFNAYEDGKLIGTEVTELNHVKRISKGSGEYNYKKITLTPIFNSGTSTPDNTNLTWTSNNTDVATVENGVVTFVKYGSATITATAQDGSGTSKSITVHSWGIIRENGKNFWGTYIQGVNIQEDNMSLNVGNTSTLHCTFEADTSDETPNPTVIWTSSNPDVVEIDASGNIKAKALGTATITAKAKYTWDEDQSDSITINVVSTVSFDGNGGTATTPTITKNGSITLPSADRTGYTFDGWYTEANGGTWVGNAGDTYISQTNVTLHAHWTAVKVGLTVKAQQAKVTVKINGVETYVVDAAADAITQTYQVDYDSNVVIDTVYKQDVVQRTTITRNSATIGNSFTMDLNTVSVDAMSTNDCKINFNLDGGSLTSGQASVTVVKDTEITLPTPTRTGYTFNGWYNGTDRIGGAGDPYTAITNITFSASWTKNYTITVNSTNAEVTVNGQSITNGGTIDIPCGTQVTVTPGFTKPNNRNIKAMFGNQNLGETDTVSGFSFEMPAGNVVITATSAKDEKTITFDYNGGTGSIVSKTEEINQTITLPTPTTAPTGYDFAGWYTAKSGGTRVDGSNDSYKVTETTTLYAHWTIKTYQITVNVVNGSHRPVIYVNGNQVYKFDYKWSGQTYTLTVNHGDIVTIKSDKASYNGSEKKKEHTFTATENCTIRIVK